MGHPIIIDDDGVLGPESGPIAKYLKSPSGRQQLAASMALPIRRSLDYHGIARRALYIEPMPQGALPYYEPTYAVQDSIVIDDDGDIKKKEDYWQGIAGKRVTIPSFQIVANPTIQISEVKRRRFNVIDRAVQRARDQIRADEDAAIFEALDNGSGNKNE
jgi:hypothetical protein